MQGTGTIRFQIVQGTRTSLDQLGSKTGGGWGAIPPCQFNQTQSRESSRKPNHPSGGVSHTPPLMEDGSDRVSDEKLRYRAPGQLFSRFADDDRRRPCPTVQERHLPLLEEMRAKVERERVRFVTPKQIQTLTTSSHREADGSVATRGK